jgi:hypothetical protein
MKTSELSKHFFVQQNSIRFATVGALCAAELRSVRYCCPAKKIMNIIGVICTRYPCFRRSLFFCFSSVSLLRVRMLVNLSRVTKKKMQPKSAARPVDTPSRPEDGQLVQLGVQLKARSQRVQQVLTASGKINRAANRRAPTRQSKKRRCARGVHGPQLLP